MSNRLVQVVGVLALLVLAMLIDPAHATGFRCGLATAAFCDSFNVPVAIGNRFGDLDGTLWGVSRQLGSSNFGQGPYYDVASTTMQHCGQDILVIAPNDVAICNGELVESVNDQHGVTSLAMNPKQPFDIVGQTGIITFDVSDDSHGDHRAWPELWYTDQPVLAPFTHFSSLQTVPKAVSAFASPRTAHRTFRDAVCASQPIQRRHSRTAAFGDSMELSGDHPQGLLVRLRSGRLPGGAYMQRCAK